MNDKAENKAEKRRARIRGFPFTTKGFLYCTLPFLLFMWGMHFWWNGVDLFGPLVGAATGISILLFFFDVEED